MAGDAQHPLDLGRRQVHLACDLIDRRLAAQLLLEAPTGLEQAADAVAHVHRYANRAALVGDGARDGLAHPPGGVGAELVAQPPVELLDRSHQPQVALLDEVQERHALVHVLLGHGDHESAVGLGEVVPGRLAVGGQCLQHVAITWTSGGRQAHSAVTAPLDAACQVHFLLRGEQRDVAHLAQNTG